MLELVIQEFALQVTGKAGSVGCAFARKAADTEISNRYIFFMLVGFRTIIEKSVTKLDHRVHRLVG